MTPDRDNYTDIETYFKSVDKAITAYEDRYGLHPVPVTPLTLAGSKVPETEEERKARLRQLELTANQIQLDKNLRRKRGKDNAQSEEA